MLRRLGAAFCIAVLASTLAVTIRSDADAQTSSIAGAWVIHSLNRDGQEPRNWEGPSLVIFTEDGYYSYFYAGPDHAAVSADPGARSQLTDEQRLAAYGSFAAHTGTYTIDGDLLTLHIYIRKSPIAVDFPDNGNPSRFRVDGDTMRYYDANNEGYTVLTRALLQ